jgi:hypothetical protein
MTDKGSGVKDNRARRSVASETAVNGRAVTNGAMKASADRASADRGSAGGGSRAGGNGAESRNGADVTRPYATQSCWLCDARLPTERMVPDGGSSCADLRWYCSDTRACTDRWVGKLPRLTEGQRTRVERVVVKKLV